MTSQLLKVTQLHSINGMKERTKERTGTNNSYNKNKKTWEIENDPTNMCITSEITLGNNNNHLLWIK